MNDLRPKRTGSCVLALVLLWGLFTLLLTASASVPRAAVEKNMTAAAELYRDKERVEELIPGQENTAVHPYSDAMWMNIAWNFDPAHPFVSAMAANYYQSKSTGQIHSFYETVTEGKLPNTGYGRYWHGTAAILKLLLCVTTVQGVRVLFSVLLAALLAAYFLLLCRRRLYAAAIGSALGVVVCTIWVTPLCFEYAPCFLIAFAASDLLLWRWRPGKDETLFFLVVGALICCFDFLTCEIVTFALPMILLLALESGTKREQLLRTVRYGLLWLAAYCATYLVKWMLAALATGDSLMNIAISKGVFRAVGEVGSDTQMGLFPQILLAMRSNLRFVFPMTLTSSVAGIWLTFGEVLLAAFCLWYLTKKRENDALLPLGLLALLPFLRYAVLSNHSALHPHFTFRCLLITIVALSALIGKSADFRFPHKKTETVREKGA